MRRSKAVTVLGWLPLLGGLAFAAFYWRAYSSDWPHPAPSLAHPAAGAEPAGLFALANYTLLGAPLLALAWAVALVLARGRGLSIGWINPLAFLSGWGLYAIVFWISPEYGAWFTY